MWFDVTHMGAIGVGQLYTYLSLLVLEVEIVRRKRDHILGHSTADDVPLVCQRTI